MDVKTAFLHGSIKQEVYVEKPMGFEVQDRDSHVCMLKKSLYGLNQAPRAWYGRIDSFLMKLAFTWSNVDPNLYFKVDREKPLILVLYVDDLFLTGANPLIHLCKRELASEFEMKELGQIYYFLGLEVSRSGRDLVRFSSRNYELPQGCSTASAWDCAASADLLSVFSAMYSRLKKISNRNYSAPQLQSRIT